MSVVKYANTARADVALIVDTILQDSVTGAESFLDDLERVVNLIGQYPLAGRKRTEVEAGVRSMPMGGYVVFYQPMKNSVVIVRVIHGARDIGSLLE